MKSNQFFNVDYVDQASYDNLRKISSAVDGLKNSSRKVIHTALDKNLDLIKVQQFASKASEYTDYLHGSMDGVIVTLGKDYVGSNQLPLLKKKGNFGTRQIPEPSASRYIFARPQPWLDKLFLKEDRAILQHQTFEGSQIEPRYFVPTLPVLFLNGNRGVSSGFAQLILPRKLQDIVQILKRRLRQEIQTFEKFDLLKPNFDGAIPFEGSVQKEDQKWLVQGKFSVTGTDLEITELPPDTSLVSYLQHLDKLKEEKLIKSYKDLCSNDKYHFKIKLASKRDIVKLFKLQDSTTENFTCIGADNKIKEFQKASEVLEYYYQIKLQSVEQRKQLNIQLLENKILKLENMIRFIQAVVSKRIDLVKTSTQDMQKYLEANHDQFDGYRYLTGLTISNFTTDKIEEFKKLLNKLNQDLKELEVTTAETLWLADIENLLKELK